MPLLLLGHRRRVPFPPSLSNLLIRCSVDQRYFSFSSCFLIPPPPFDIFSPSPDLCFSSPPLSFPPLPCVSSPQPLDYSEGFVVLEPEWITQMISTVVTQQNSSYDGSPSSLFSSLFPLFRLSTLLSTHRFLPSFRLGILPIRVLREDLWHLSSPNVQDGLLSLLESIQVFSPFLWAF